MENASTTVWGKSDLVIGGVDGFGKAVWQHLTAISMRVETTYSLQNGQSNLQLSAQQREGFLLYAYGIEIADIAPSTSGVANIVNEFNLVDIAVDNLDVNRKKSMRKMRQYSSLIFEANMVIYGG
jgi:hypothetical protein